MIASINVRIRVLVFCVISMVSIELSSCKQESNGIKKSSPEMLFPGLFQAVQTGNVFPDSKTFPDCLPKLDPDVILKKYNRDSKDKDFNLKTFVAENFVIPTKDDVRYKSDKSLSVEEHIDRLWPHLQRNADKYSRFASLIELPHPYIVPGGRFQEIYYWDSYFTMLGLIESGREALAEDMLNNLAYLIRSYGFVPNGNRTYYLSRSQPPFFAAMLGLVMESRKVVADSILAANRDALEREYFFWMKGNKEVSGADHHLVVLEKGVVMNRYFDLGEFPRPEAYLEDVRTAKESKRDEKIVYRDIRSGAESGWDFSSRWLDASGKLSGIHTTDIIPVDLNCLLYNLEDMLATAYNKAGDKSASSHMTALAKARKENILRYCWDKQNGWFQDFDWKKKAFTGNLSIAGMFPLYFKLVSASRADSVGRTLSKRFLKAGGVVTSLNNTGEQWDAPNGWAPLQWISYSGLSKYGNTTLASNIATRWLALNESVFKKTGKMLEKYNVEDITLLGGGGEYENQDGFGWTNGVYLKMKHAEELRKTSSVQ